MYENQSVIDSVIKHFGFLLDAGYKIESLEKTGAMSGWNLKLISNELVLRLISDRGEWFLVISPSQEERWFSLEVLIFFITNEVELIPLCDKALLNDGDKQLFRLAQILEKHFSNIKSVFGTDFHIHKDKLLALTKRVNSLQIKAGRK